MKQEKSIFDKIKKQNGESLPKVTQVDTQFLVMHPKKDKLDPRNKKPSSTFIPPTLERD